MYDNTGWTVTDTAAECTSGDGESWDTVVTYSHNDGRWVQESHTFTLMGEVLVDGERPDEIIQDGFLGDVDEFWAEVICNVDEYEHAITRRYFFDSHSETRYAGWGDVMLEDFPDRVESDQCIAPGDLPTYDGPVESTDLDDAVTAHLEDWARDWSSATLRFNDLDDMHANLTA